MFYHAFKNGGKREFERNFKRFKEGRDEKNILNHQKLTSS